MTEPNRLGSPGPYPALPPPPIPTLWRRLAARCIDWVGIGLPLLLASSGVYLGRDDRTLAPLGLALAAFMLYEFVMYLVLGATVGKLVLGCQVVTVYDSSPLDYHRAGLRALLPSVFALGALPFAGDDSWIAGVLLGVWSFSYFTPIFDPRGRGWADRAAGTVVVRVR